MMLNRSCAVGALGEKNDRIARHGSAYLLVGWWLEPLGGERGAGQNLTLMRAISCVAAQPKQDCRREDSLA